MINPYAAPRVQRLVPERTASGMWLMQQQAAKRLNLMAGEFRAQILGRARALAAGLLRKLRLLEVEEEALVSGAMPAEFDPKELRYVD